MQYNDEMKKSSPFVSFLMLNWNGIEYTRKCLTSLLASNYPHYEIIVVDNGSDNNEGDMLKREFGKKITLIKNPKNVGYAEGMNVAYAHSHGEMIMLLNNDMEFPKNWLRPLVSVLIKNPQVGGVQPKIRDIKNKSEFEYASAAGGFVDMFGYPFARGRIFYDIEKDNSQYENPIRVSWAGIFLIRRVVLEKIGLFDSIYFNYGEDMDLCMRIYRAGYKIINIPQSIVYHVGGGALKKDLRKKMFYHHRNNLIFIMKNWPLGLLILIFIPRMVFDLLSAFYYLGRGFMDGFYAVFEAYVSLVTMLPDIFRHRTLVQAQGGENNLKNMPFYRGSVVLDYYAFGKKKFSDIIKNKSFYEANIKI